MQYAGAGSSTRARQRRSRSSRRGGRPADGRAGVGHARRRERGIVRAAGRPSALRHVRREPAGVCAARSLLSALKASAPCANVALLARDAPVVPPGRDHVLDRVGEDRAPQRGSRFGCRARLDGLDAVGERGDGFGRERPLGPGGERLRSRDARSVVGGVALQERDDAERDRDAEGGDDAAEQGALAPSRRRAGSRARTAAAARSGSAPCRVRSESRSASSRSRPRRSRLGSRRASHSTARTSRRVWARAHSRSVSSARESFAKRGVAIVGVAAPDPVQLRTPAGCLRVGLLAGDRDDALAVAPAPARAPRSTCEASELVLTTKTKLSAPSIESSMSRSHSDAGGMSSQSTQTSPPARRSARVQLADEPASRREYETKTSALLAQAASLLRVVQRHSA